MLNEVSFLELFHTADVAQQTALLSLLELHQPELSEVDDAVHALSLARFVRLARARSGLTMDKIVQSGEALSGSWTLSKIENGKLGVTAPVQLHLARTFNLSLLERALLHQLAGEYTRA